MIFDESTKPDNSTYRDWNLLSPEKRQMKVNQSRNYLRYRISKGMTIEPDHPMLTPEERMLVADIQNLQNALIAAKIGFFTHFYDNCPKVGSTLKRKIIKDIEII